MKRRMSVNKMMNSLRSEKINTWFDLGIFIDRFKENKPLPTINFKGDYNTFKQEIANGGMAFITFYYSIDGVTVEVEKYAKIFKRRIPKVPIHYIAGHIFSESEDLIDENAIKYEIPEIRGFEKWNLYEKFYFTKLERGSEAYNELIIKFWEQTLIITEKLGKYIETHNIKLLYLINVCSNPGNVALSLACVFVSEYLGISVINNNHDFYWEGGNRKQDIKNKGLKKGPRDFFFLNSDIGEFFSQIEILFPWESRSWLSVNINKGQSEHLIRLNGHNPANVMEISTAVDTDEYTSISKRKKINSLLQVETILSRYSNTLIGYSVNDVFINKLVDCNNPKPILITGFKTKAVRNFLAENIIFLQPTRIIYRKRIEFGLKLLKKLFSMNNFTEKFDETNKLKITIIVTGPISDGHYNYLEKVIKRFKKLVDNLEERHRDRVYLAFLFSEFDTEQFKQKYREPLSLPDLYNIASLVLLPSKTEGRGLPIIEATSCGTPIFCRRYFPEEVYSQVIGEHLPEKERLNVIEFEGKRIPDKMANIIIDKVFYPHKYNKENEHNRNVIHKRYSLNALELNIEEICYRLYLQIKSNSIPLKRTKEAFKVYKKWLKVNEKKLNKILDNTNRQYLPGYGKLSFMLYLKSLIDPSYFRVEEQQIRGLAFSFAYHIINIDPDLELIPIEKIVEFYNSVDNIFNYREGEVEIQHDHSFSYRHRNKNYYPYQQYTIQEISGIINYLYHKIIMPAITAKVLQNAHFFTDWKLALAQLTSSSFLAIDNRNILIEKLQANIPIAYFPGNFIKNEIEFFVLQSVRSRLDMDIEDELSLEILEKSDKFINPVYLFAEKRNIGTLLNYNQIIDYIINGKDKELKLLYEYGILQIIKSDQICQGIHFAQIGDKGIEVLSKIKKEKGVLISNRPGAAEMTDILDIDRIHIGKVTNSLSANIMGIPEGSGYIQFVPAGIRTTLSYPTPIQTSKHFYKIINSRRFKSLLSNLGTQKVWDEIRKDAVKNGSPLNYVLDSLEKNETKKNTNVEYKYVNGLYEDGNPWNGVLAKTFVSNPEKTWEFITLSGGNTIKKVSDFIVEFENKTNKKAEIAWNGGYILNAELVGKLGLPESYIGSPLGLLISNKKLLCPPLFNKPALLVYPDGTLDIKRVNIENGFKASSNGISIEFDKKSYNNENYNKQAYYDLIYHNNSINANGKTIIRLAGNRIKEIIRTKKDEKVKIIPVGLTLSFPSHLFPEEWNEIGLELEIYIKEFENITNAVEAGPLLIENGEFKLNMQKGGWKTQNSIRTQAARLDYTDMRGPKIAVGLDKKGDLFILTINGRIRESVGATHIDMAKILLKYGIVKAMGFDPGGSSTLVVENKVLNISPYNINYENNVYALPPQPRAVANAVIGYIK